jgi:hypothetical protein
MARLYVFADEAGNFDFTRNRGASRYFILATVMAHSCDFGFELLELHRELAWEGLPVKGFFHATTDTQVVRDEVFRKICAHDFTIQATIMEKSKAHPITRRTESEFYKTGWLYHFRSSLKNPVNRSEEFMVAAASVATKKRQIDFEDSIRSVVKQYAHEKLKWRVATWRAHSDPCLQLADYCTWAIQRKWEGRDPRSYDLISDRITYEFDLWEHGSVHWY